MPQKKYYHDHVADTGARVTKEMLFGPHDRNAHFVLGENCYFDLMEWMLLSRFAGNVISTISQIRYILVVKLIAHSAYFRNIADM